MDDGVVPKLIWASKILGRKNGHTTQTFSSVPILYLFMTPETRADKGILNLEPCEHPLKFGALFTLLYLFSVP